MSPEKLRLIASLKFDPAYMALCEVLEERHNDDTARLAESSDDDATTLRNFRLWQISHTYLHNLKTLPQNVLDGLEVENEGKSAGEVLSTDELLSRAKHYYDIQGTSIE